jgi:predicted nucleic acid-binding protein
LSEPFFDTNIVIDWLFDREPAIVELSRYRKHRISRIVWSEVLAGEPPHERPRLQQLMSPFEIVEIDGRIALAAAAIRHRSRMKLIDAFILATAQVNGAILVTRNTKDFPEAFPGIRMPYKL